MTNISIYATINLVLSVSNMEFLTESVLGVLAAIVLISARIRVVNNKQTKDKKFIKLQGLATAYLLQEYPEHQTIEFKPVYATQQEWCNVVSNTYNCNIII